MTYQINGTVVINASRQIINITTITASGDLTLSGTGAIKVPSGTTAQRPTDGHGKIRFNTTVGKFEGHHGTSWGTIGGGATGGASDDVFYENSKLISADYTITTGKNAMTAGPITINDGVNITVPDGSVWTIV